MYFSIRKRGIIQLPLMIGLLIMAVVLPALTTIVKTNQDTRNKAAMSATTYYYCEKQQPTDPTKPGGGLMKSVGYTGTGDCRNYIETALKTRFDAGEIWGCFLDPASCSLKQMYFCSQTLGIGCTGTSEKHFTVETCQKAANAYAAKNGIAVPNTCFDNGTCGGTCKCLYGGHVLSSNEKICQGSTTLVECSLEGNTVLTDCSKFSKFCDSTTKTCEYLKCNYKGVDYPLGQSSCTADGKELIICSSTGGSADIKDCDSSGQVCDPTTKGCKAKGCFDHESGTAWCEGNVATSCLNGNPTYKNCSDVANSTCLNGSCSIPNECPGGKVDGSAWCDNNTIRRCSGTQLIDTPCTGSTPVCSIASGYPTCIAGSSTDVWYWNATSGASGDGCDHLSGKPVGCTFGPLPAGVSPYTGELACKTDNANKCPIWYTRDATVCNSNGRYNCTANANGTYKSGMSSENFNLCTGACTYYQIKDGSSQPICTTSTSKFECKMWDSESGIKIPDDRFSTLSACGGTCLPYWKHGAVADDCNQLGNWVCTRTATQTSFSGASGYQACSDDAGCEPHGFTPGPNKCAVCADTKANYSGPDKKGSDYDCNGIVNGGDFVVWRAEYIDKLNGKTKTRYEANGSCYYNPINNFAVNLSDYSQWRQDYLN